MTQYIRKNQCESVQLDDEWMILNTDNITITKLNAAGGYCWTLLDSARTLKSLVEAVQEKYGQTDESVEKDIEAFLSDLIRCGLVHHADQQ